MSEVTHSQPHKTLEGGAPGDQQGIAGSDLDYETNKNTAVAGSILDAHMPKYDGYVGAARAFVADELGMMDVQPVDRVAVLSTDTAEAWGGWD